MPLISIEGHDFRERDPSKELHNTGVFIKK
jgi:hypothetical protein